MVDVSEIGLDRVAVVTEIRRWLVNLEQCTGALNDAQAIRESMRVGCTDSGATIRREINEPYVPHGVTVAMILAESHFVVSTWPEWRFCTLDISVCSSQLQLQLLVDPLLQLLEPVVAGGQLTTTRLPDGRIETHHLDAIVAASA